MQKTASKNTKYSKNDKFLKMAKIGNYAKAIGFQRGEFRYSVQKTASKKKGDFGS